MLNASSSADDIPKNVAPPPPNKKRDLALRVVSSTVLISFQCLCYALGHLYYSLFLICVGFTVYWEMIKIKRNENKDMKIGMQNTLDWYFAAGFVFYLLPQTLLRRVTIENDPQINFKYEMNIYAVNIGRV